MQDQQLTRPKLKDFSEISTTPVISSGSLTLDLETGNVFEVVLAGSVTSLTWPIRPSPEAPARDLIVRQEAPVAALAGRPRSVGRRRAATGHSAAAGAIDIYAFVTRDTGTTWYGFIGGKGFG